MFLHFKCLGLSVHKNSSGTFKDLMTYAVYFESPGENHNEMDTPLILVQNGYTTYTGNFTYIGSKVTHDINNGVDIEARKKQATKALGARMKGMFHNPHLEVKTKRVLYLVIPINLLFWRSKTWALKESDWKSLQVFHTKEIRKI